MVFFFRKESACAQAKCESLSAGQSAEHQGIPQNNPCDLPGSW